MRACHLPDFLLREVSQRKHLPRQLVLGKTVEEIALVLGLVQSPQHGEASIRHPGDTRVVPRREFVEDAAGLTRKLREKTKLQDGIAPHAGIRRATGQIGVAEVGHHLAVVDVEAIVHLVVDADLLREFRRARDVLFLMRTEAGITVATLVDARTPKLHRNAHDLVPRLLQQERGHAGVDSSTQTYGDLHCSTSFSNRPARGCRRHAQRRPGWRRPSSPRTSSQAIPDARPC